MQFNKIKINSKETFSIPVIFILNIHTCRVLACNFNTVPIKRCFKVSKANKQLFSLLNFSTFVRFLKTNKLAR